MVPENALMFSERLLDYLLNFISSTFNKEGKKVPRFNSGIYIRETAMLRKQIFKIREAIDDESARIAEEVKGDQNAFAKHPRVLEMQKQEYPLEITTAMRNHIERMIAQAVKEGLPVNESDLLMDIQEKLFGAEGVAGPGAAPIPNEAGEGGSGVAVEAAA